MMKHSVLSTATAIAVYSSAVYPAELRMSWWGGDSRHEATLAALDACGAKHGHTIIPDANGWSGYFEKLTSQIASGTEADLVQIDWPWLSVYSADGTGFADLNRFSDTIDLSNYDAAQIAAGTMNGVLNGLPASTTGRLFLFNENTWAEAGLELPTTWDELLAAGPIFHEKLGATYFPFEVTLWDAFLIMTLYGTQATGRALIDPATNDVAWTRQELTEAIGFVQTLIDNGVIPPWPINPDEGNIPLHKNPAWADGRIGGTYQWDSTYFKIADPLGFGERLAISDLLSQDGQKTAGIYRKASMVFSISANSPNQKAAAQVLNCLLNEPDGVLALGATRGVPASITARDQLLSAGLIEDIQIEAQAKVIASEGPAIHPITEFPLLKSAMKYSLEQFIYQEIDAATAADDIIDAIKDALKDFR